MWAQMSLMCCIILRTIKWHSIQKLNLHILLIWKNNKIKGVLEGIGDDNAVNFKQLYSYVNAAKIQMQTKINTLTTKLQNATWLKKYCGIWLEEYADFLNSSQIQYKDDGSTMSLVGMLTLTTTETKFDLSNTNGLIDFNATLSSNLETNAHYTIYYVINFTTKNNNYISVKHKTNSGITDLTYTLFYYLRNNVHMLQILRSLSERSRINIENKCYNKQVMFWIVKIRTVSN